MSEIKLNSIEDAVKDFKEGKFVIVVDDEDRENEGDLIIAAEKIDAEKVNFMLKHARGVLCAPITLSRCDELDLPHQFWQTCHGAVFIHDFHKCACWIETCHFTKIDGCFCVSASS